MSETISDILVALDADVTWIAYDSPQSRAVSDGIPEFYRSKGFSTEAVQLLAQDGKTLGLTLDTLFFGNHRPKPTKETIQSGLSRANFLSSLVASNYRDDGMTPRLPHYAETGARKAYTGGISDHRSIFKALTTISNSAEAINGETRVNPQRQYRRNGASRKLWLPTSLNVGEAYGGERLSRQPIAIVGGGAAGVLAAGMLAQVGFTNITIFDKRGRTNGLWQQDNVRDGTKNNPFPIEFQSAATNAADSGRITHSGRGIDTFLNKVKTKYHPDDAVTIRKAVIKGIDPGDLAQRITFIEDGETKTETFPLVIYAPGIGEPLDPNDPARMSTSISRSEVGQRWQRQFKHEDYKRLGSSVVLVGLGNSTAEVVHQLQEKAPGIPYTILTHLSQRAVIDPRNAVDGPALYRNLRRPELTRLAGDLPHINRVLSNAIYRDRIVTGVRNWERTDGTIRATDYNGDVHQVAVDSLFTLVGYGQNPEVNDRMGLATSDKRTGSIQYDFDGEVQWGGYDEDAHSVRQRVFPGYFAVGPILKNTVNPNAIVIPGIQHQLQFLVASLVMRAAEATCRGLVSPRGVVLNN